MQAELRALDEQQAELAALLANCGPADWARPSRCEGWTVADLVLHLAQTNELATASAAGRFTDGANELGRGVEPASSIDNAADRAVARDRHHDAMGILRRWESSVHSLRDALGGCEPGRRVEWVAGTLSARTLATTRLAETWIHTGDVADALGGEPGGDELNGGDRLRLIARLAWRTLPYAFALSGRELTGPVAFELVGPGGEQWTFDPEAPAVTRIIGDALDLCLVAARRLDPSATSLRSVGADGPAVLELVRTYA